MTNRLYYADSHTQRFEARIVERLTWQGQPAVVLDATYFYPSGGGQPNDIGHIGGCPVIDVVTRPQDLAVVHVLSCPAPSDDSVTATLDWERRFDHMQHHTGQHILTQAFVQLCEANTVGFHLSPATVTIDLDRTDLTVEQLLAAEQLTNQIIWQNQPVSARIYQTVEELRAAGVRMRRLPDHIATEGLRVVEIGTFDATACGGTHVHATGEIGLLKVVKTEKRGDKLRVEFRCGARALSDYAQRVTITQQLTTRLTVGLNELPEAVERLQDAMTSAQRTRKAAMTRLIEAQTTALLAQANPSPAGQLISWVADPALYDANDLRAMAKHLTARRGVIALLALPSEAKAQWIFARAADLAADMNALLKHALTVLEGARGGGTPDFAQGGGIPATSEQCQSVLDRAAASV